MWASPRRGSGELREGTHRASWEGGRTSSTSPTARLHDDAMSHIPNCPVGNVSREWWVGRKKMTSSGARLLDWHADAEARRADRIHVTLTKDLRQTRSYLTRLTTHSLAR